MNQYIALTIGPIVATLSLATKPAALWAGSYLFSYLSKELCRRLTQDPNVGAENILCPYCSPEEGFFDRDDSLGLFPDHVVFRQSASYLETLKGHRDAALEKVSEVFGIELAYLRQYVMVSACAFEAQAGENPILCCGKMLDSLELAPPFVPQETENPLLSSFRNDAVKTLGGRLGLGENWQLLRRDGDSLRIRDIPSIAAVAGANGFKKRSYYCLLRADGDNMGKLLSHLDADACREFSRRCLDYGVDAAKLVGEFGGVTVYVGGDDLLALLPCEDCRGNTILDFIHQMTAEVFPKHFCSEDVPWAGALGQMEKKGHAPSLSFGAILCHEKYPLYEALAESARLLFGVAKNTQGKNCTALLLRKHSGQSVELLISHKEGGMDGLAALLREVLGRGEAASSGDSPDLVLLSAWEKLALFRSLFLSAGSDSVENLFRNIFDSDFHVSNGTGFLHERLPRFYRETCLTGRLSKDAQEPTPIDALSQTLHMLKFFAEKGAED